MKTPTKAAPIACTPKSLPRDRLIPAAMTARVENPTNHPPLHKLSRIIPGFQPTALEIAIVTTKYWRTNGVKLGVGFLDNPPNELRTKILSHMNAWGKTANVVFAESKDEPKVRISRAAGGYWSYLGTDILDIASNEQTMNLEGFTMQTADSEFYRVVRHETGHTLGCPHEHMRAELVAKIDPEKAIEYYGDTQGWTPEEVRQQVLTPLDPDTLQTSGPGDVNSIMCYQIPGTITFDGMPITGGTDIDVSDYTFMAKIYPKPAAVSVPSEPAPAAAVAAVSHRHTCPDCIQIELHHGRKLIVPPDVSEAQLRVALAAADG